MKELDVVKLIKNHDNISAGTKGAIVHKYNNKDYLVEFVDDNGDTIDVVMVNSKEIELLIEFKLKK